MSETELDVEAPEQKSEVYGSVEAEGYVSFEESSPATDRPTSPGTSDRLHGNYWHKIKTFCSRWFHLMVVPRKNVKPLICSVSIWTFFMQVYVTCTIMAVVTVVVFTGFANFTKVLPIYTFLMGLWFNTALTRFKQKQKTKRKRIKQRRKKKRHEV